jgi:hypothetical protein
MDLLSRPARVVCFVRVSSPPRSPGASVAPIVIAATVGALLTLGVRRGGALEPFIGGGQLLIPGAARWVAAAIGGLLHGAWMAAWSALYGTVARDRSGWRPMADAAGIAALAFVVALILPEALLGPTGTLTTPERIFFHVLLAIALGAGMRLAPDG